MNKKTQNKLQLLFTGSLLISFAIAGCNNGNEKTETKTDTVITEKSMEVSPAPIDTTIKKTTDTAKTRPTPTGN